MTILQAVEVRKFYGTFCALDGVSLVIGEGEHVSIIGPNGAGKTTLVNVLTGLLPPSAGTVTFKGHDIGRLGPLRLLRLGMARSFQLVNIFPQLSVRETIAIAAISSLGMGGRAFAPLRKNRRVWETVERVAGLFGLAGKLEQPTKSLSQGDKKLLDVASAFALSPEIILLDEPTSGVSTAEKTTIMQVLARAAKETGIKAIIQVEHDMDIVFGYSSRIIAVHNGKILADGSPAMIRARDDVMAIVVGRP
ncbi:MAG: ATP-binding cassette domain-containing protein [Alphaproteobacteria bacterium]|jgi:branched-chain amino acid transport system ATP-binding protein|nr:MAG: ATP-binding cassette domain-containing protein [Alphaproteobacteria bacterium]